MKENRRTYETIDRKLTSEYHKMAPQQRQERFGNQQHIVQTTAGGSNTIPTRQHPELGQARMEYDSTQRVTAS